MHLYHSEAWRKMSLCGNAFLGAGIDELLHSEKSFNALEYRKILQNGVFPAYEKLLEEWSDVTFQHDNALAQTTKKWFENKSNRLMFFGLVRVQIWTL